MDLLLAAHALRGRHEYGRQPAVSTPFAFLKHFSFFPLPSCLIDPPPPNSSSQLWRVGYPRRLPSRCQIRHSGSVPPARRGRRLHDEQWHRERHFFRLGKQYYSDLFQLHDRSERDRQCHCSYSRPGRGREDSSWDGYGGSCRGCFCRWHDLVQGLAFIPSRAIFAM